MSRESEPLLRALNRMRSVILDPEQLVKAVASGKQRGTTPKWRRAELRYVDLKAGRHLQITTYDATQAFTANHPVGDSSALDDLLDEPFANWILTTATEQTQIQAKTPTTALVSTTELTAPVEAERGHDQAKERLLPESDPVFRVLGLSDRDGKLKPSRQAKYRQVEEFLRQLDAALGDAMKSGKVRRPTAEDPLRIIDLGAGNGYLTFAAQRYLTEVRELPVVVTGVDVKEQSREHNSKIAAELGVNAEFVAGTIEGVQLAEQPDVVLALHACDTATDDALARAVEWEAPLILAAPCCHHDIAAQLRKAPTPAPYSMLTRHGILRERFADTLTDALRASLLRLAGYRVEVVQFVESQHTPRNTMLRAIRTGSPVKGGSVKKEYDELVAEWGVRPKLGELLAK
ncbi:SAM-dependent methyltransferase [Nocardioides luteus]|uniref:Methyltransferase n=1 Tax=Nocardioides luteus TaxID=1844 RepID=A0ABQ5SZT6_9ACTN|nr:SAM-dependent methyltransferase [Nocardioides luteus]MDR7313561.1 SAM-dependent methyltransferase [Nocardioides luteus]GGR68856.1 methyltransferase [Nocardioides luteus]GLJ69183.1 methyltransferase [Nocardioides luteus]